MNAIEVKHITSAYDETIILDDFNVAIPKGAITIIIGPNGCGKSTLLKSIGRVKKLKHGDVFIYGKNMKHMASKTLAKQMAYLPQHPITPPSLVVKDLVSFGRFPYQKSFGSLSKEDLNIIDWAMKETGLYDVANQRVDELSGGQRQRAWISVALAQKSEIMLLDEPTTYLDIAYQLEVLQLLKQLNYTQGNTIVMVLHELNLACRFANHIIGMKKGKMIFQGKPNDVITQKNLKLLYGIDVTLQQSDDKTYPICIDYQI